MLGELMEIIDPQPLLIQTQLADEAMSLGQTSAGQIVFGEITNATEEMKERFNQMIKQLQGVREMAEEDRAKYWELMEESGRELKEKLQLAQRDLGIMTKEVNELRDNTKREKALNKQLSEAYRRAGDELKELGKKLEGVERRCIIL